MKIILFSDIHANLPALDAFFAHAEKQEADMMYCLGDLVGYNIWPNEVIAEIRRRKIPVIAGNYDYGVGLHSNDCGCAYKTDKDREMGAVSIAFTNDIIGKEERYFLRMLPLQIRIQLQLKDGPASLLLVHGSPRKINEYLFEDREESSMLRIMNDADADILCFGHTHKPFHRVLMRPEARYCHAINTGAVGKPKDGNPQGCYVALSIDENSSLAEPGGIKVAFVRFDYDVDQAAAAIENSVLPRQYAALLREGI
jgi:putative phosphoesterase